MAIILGAEWQRDLWASKYRLRYELSGGGAHVSMFTKAYDRARALARAALPGDELVGIIAAYPAPKKEVGARWRGWMKGTAFEILHEMGVSTDREIASWGGYWWAQEEDDPEAEPWVQRAVRLTWDQADILLWNQVAHDIGVTPQAPVLSKLANLESGVCVYAYDDRGMDITALTREPLADLHVPFDGWLLDFDRPRIAAAFKG